MLKPNIRKSKAIVYFGVLITYSVDALNANKMNAKPGGKQLLMHDTVYNGKPQSMKKRILVGGHYQ